MFSLVHHATPNALAYEAVPADEPGRLIEMSKRLDIVKNFVKDLGTRAGIVPSKIDALCIGMNECMFSCKTNSFYGDNVIFLPNLLFMDFTKDFGVETAGELREKLGNSEWVDFFCDRCTQILKGKVIDREGIELFRQRLDSLSSGAEACIQAMPLNNLQVEAVRTCLLRYTMPDTFCKQLIWLSYRVIQAIYSIFNDSDWDEIQSMIEAQGMSILVNQGVVQENPQNSIEEKIKKTAERHLSIISERLLATALLAQKEKIEISDALQYEIDGFRIGLIISVINTQRQKIIRDVVWGLA